jgi:hypothetical protein
VGIDQGGSTGLAAFLLHAFERAELETRTAAGFFVAHAGADVARHLGLKVKAELLFEALFLFPFSPEAF